MKSLYAGFVLDFLDNSCVQMRIADGNRKCDIFKNCNCVLVGCVVMYMLSLLDRYLS